RLVRALDKLFDVTVVVVDRYLVDLHVCETSAADQRAQLLLVPQHEHPRLARYRRRHMAASDENPAGHRNPRVAITARPNRKRKPPTGSQHPPRLGERDARIRHQHVPPATDDAVDGIVLELEILGIE